MGFSAKQYPIYHSIRISDTEGIWIDGVEIKFGTAKEDFKQGDIVGIGIMHSTTNSSGAKCFVTLNGKLLGKINEEKINLK